MNSYYSQNADDFLRQYESLSPASVNREWAGFIPERGSRILDVGAGSGRDSAWMASMGHAVVAVEPADGLRKKAMAAHPDPFIRWSDDSLPALASVRGLRLRFDLVLVNAVWMHVAPAERENAFGNLRGLLSPGGRLVITLRHGPSPDEREMHPVHCGELTALADRFALDLLHSAKNGDKLGREAVSWSTMVFSLPDGQTRSTLRQRRPQRPGNIQM